MLKRVVCFVAMVCLTVASRSQNAAVEQIRGRVETISSEDRGELRMISEDRGEVVELNGKPARALRFRTGFSTGIEHQSNAPLLGSGQRDDWLSISAMEAGFNKPLGEKFSFDLSHHGDVARYFHIRNISYWGPSATALFDYRPRAGLPRLYAGGQLYRFDLIDTGNKITDAGAVIAGLDQSWVFQGGRSGISAGYIFSRYWAFPQSEDRTSQTVFATFTHQFMASLYAQLGYIWQYTDFDDPARYDSRHTVGLALFYAPKDKLLLRLYANFVRNESSNPLTDYENFTAGVGGIVSIQF